jgi:hypothetical protein
MAVALDAALSLDLRHAQSSTQRGKTYAPVLLGGLVDALTITSKASEILIQAQSGRSWTISQGSFLRNGRIFLDWTINVQLRTDGTYGISTPKYLSKNGALANASNHDSVRDSLDANLVHLSSLASETEVGLSREMLGRPVEGSYPGHAGQRQIELAVETSRAIEDVRTCLDQGVGMAVLSRGGDRWRFGFGLERSWAENWIEVWTVPSEVGTSLLGVVTIGPSVGGLADECASFAAQLSFAFIQEALVAENHTFVMTPASFKGALA